MWLIRMGAVWLWLAFLGLTASAQAQAQNGSDVRSGPAAAASPLHREHKPLGGVRAYLPKGCAGLDSNVVFDGPLQGGAPRDRSRIFVRINDSLGAAQAPVRAAIDRLGFVTIDDNADFELTVLRDYPDALVLVDAREGYGDWFRSRTELSHGCRVHQPRQF
ncbi:MAG: hypothetical protein ACKOPQ_04300, partial [Novosphingobium sp.]